MLPRLNVTFSWVLLGLCFLPAILWADVTPLELERSPMNISVGRYLEYLPVSAEESKLSLIRKRLDWRPVGVNLVTLGFYADPIWVRIRLENKTPRELSFFLQESYPLLDELIFYIPDERGGFTKYKTGDTLPFRRRLIQHRSFMVPITIPPAAGKTVYISYKSRESIRCELSLLSWRGLFEKIAYQDPFLWLYFGFLLVIFIYNFFLLLSIRDLAYLYYLFYILCFLIMQFFLLGFGAQYVWLDYPAGPEYMLRFISPLSVSFFVLFLRAFIGVKPYYLWLDRSCLFLVGLFLSWAVFGIVGDAQIFWIGLMGGVGGFAVWITVFLTLLVRKKSREAILAAFAFSFFAPTVLFLALDFLGIIPASNFSRYGLLLASILEITFFSLALAYRVNQAREAHMNSEKRFRELLNNLNDILLTLDSRLYITSLNPAVIEELGFDEEQLLGSFFPDLVYEQKQEQLHRTRGFVSEQILALSAENDRSSFTAYINTRFKPEPVNMEVELELIPVKGQSQILVRMSPVIEGFLTDTLAREHQVHNMCNSFSDAEFLSERLTSRLSKRLAEDALYSLRLALREALYNAVEHGNLEIDAEQKRASLTAGVYPDLIRRRMLESHFENRRVHVEYTLTDKKVSYVIGDEGPGFEHVAVLERLRREDAGTMGLLRMESVFDVMEFREGGREVLLVKEFP